ncbi:hypothetical protein [Microvirga pakistanensis]|uniref:hypothetical protein n=1 Tax=Microvirga pakistanensis TaxID=1682650 RepID=UPI00106BA6E1|nr:hypothetical protein [Microvirga pakistanensis]
MTMIRKPFEMPFLHTMPNDFGLGDRFTNREHLERLLATPCKVIHQDDTVLLAVTASQDRHEVFMYRKDEHSLTYYLTYKVEQIEPLRVVATEVALWRRSAPGLERSTGRIFDYLFKRIDSVVSAPTGFEGERFWIDRMAEGHAKGLAVGVMDGDSPIPYDDSRHLLDWVQALDASGGKDQSKRRRYFISRAATKSGSRNSP